MIFSVGDKVTSDAKELPGVLTIREIEPWANCESGYRIYVNDDLYGWDSNWFKKYEEAD